MNRMSERAPAVLVHGNPETDSVRDPLLAELGRDDVVCLPPPGFGGPAPGFGATVGEYRDWLVGRLEAFDGPVDLVGHHWGGGHVVNAAMSRSAFSIPTTSGTIWLRRGRPWARGGGWSPG